ncbi:MAG: putative secreted protein [Methanobacterium sp. Maddingley MBC34]|nr:MAG: putative secreted protein [Methanobacterium sp. Maddingley MBC34]
MKRLLLALIILIAFLGPIYSASTSGFAITYGETTYNNPSYKSTVNTYFQSHTDKNLNNSNTKVVTASQVNQIAKNITGRTYNSNQIFSCALVDLSYSQGIKIIVDTSKINTVTSKMYANALKSTGIENGYVVVTSPVSATGESALTGVLESYEVAVGTSIPEEAKKAATEELYTETQIANQTGQSADKIAELFDKAKQEVQKQNLQDPTQIKVIVINVANSLNINLSDQQAQDIANALANSQKVQGSLTDFKNQLQAATQQATQSQGILDQIKNYLQSFYDYIMSFFGG